MSKLEKLAIAGGFTLEQVIKPMIENKIRLKALRSTGKLTGWKATDRDGKFLGYYWM